MGIEVGGIGGLIILVLDVYAIVKILGSGASTGAKVGWTVAVLLLPILGVILWFLFGPKR
ncbi:MAG: PLD nuclease N-terminal domain-containing protein [Pseudomonadales bacterium]